MFRAFLLACASVVLLGLTGCGVSATGSAPAAVFEEAPAPEPSCGPLPVPSTAPEPDLSGDLDGKDDDNEIRPTPAVDC
jgi:hypothetical protein